MFLERDVERAREWIRRRPGEPGEWRDAGTLTGHKLLVTADELRALTERVNELVEPYRFRGRQDDPPPGARPVHFTLTAFPGEEA